jgi:putative two-component system response regulator
VVADDEESIRFIVADSLSAEGFEVFEAVDGEDAIEVIEKAEPHLIVLDLMMPRLDGYGVMEEVRRVRPDLPVLMLSALSRDEPVWKAWQSGIDWYMTKPFDLDELVKAAHRLLGTIPGEPGERAPIAIEPPVGDPAELAANLLVACLRARSPAIAERSERVARMAVDMMAQLKLSIPEPAHLSQIVLFDLGYVGVPDEVLGAGRSLSPEELRLVRSHALLGESIMTGHPDLSLAASLAATHHEWFDGSGYPNGLAGEQIPIISRVLAVADAFDAMTHPRPFRETLDAHEAMRRLSLGAGKQFDPEILRGLTPS